ncbi:TetR/AcrR family transcriptional regulator [Mycolicibacterium neoaurum]|uniref:TetR/AcrR family transcriptional regulator n=1 Tax=Mycolicibacterium neoaurum TaxID=1795 RepID=UPI002673BE51|nr:TetR/AcrR family transcriptional regulator [Mycolicibacterium neoaurum]MDO3401161.1 TetR/AcrR family transcriptional regulator [Mycolicibacterium neoaurum]
MTDHEATDREQAPASRQRARRTRANGDRSRERILGAATAVATERGYDGTTISAVSKASGLPPTSIYWHFTDKDDLIAAVIDRSYQRWAGALRLPTDGDADSWAGHIGLQVAKALQEEPDFLRLGLKLALDRRPAERHAKTKFLQSRADAFDQFANIIRAVAPGLADDRVEALTTYLIAGADGLFIANEIDGNAQRFVELFELHARLVFQHAIGLLD